MDRPVLMSAPMVRALLDGKKSQTRRVCNDQDDGLQWKHVEGVATWPENWDGKKALPYTGWIVSYPNMPLWLPRTCPYGEPGDRLWVRETWAHYQTINSIRRYDGASSSQVSDGLAGYKADGFDTIEEFREHVRAMSGLDLEEVEINGSRWRPSIHMPRWASRLTLRITDVRVERLQDISPDDAAAEGWPGPDAAGTIASSYPIAWYSHLWEKINGKRAPWSSNPFVWTLTFEVLK